MNHEVGLSVEERVASLFQQDTLLPAQYFETFRRKFQLEPEKRLMLAILDDAVTCFQKHLSTRDNRGKALYREAEEWIFDESDESLFSFDNVCEALGFDAKYVRQGLGTWKQNKLTQPPRAKVYRFPAQGQRKKTAFVASRKNGQRRLKAASR
jgi:hypothetical protein